MLVSVPHRQVLKSGKRVVVVPSIPRNKTGKRLKIPLKRIVKGESISEVLALGAVVNPDDISEPRPSSHTLCTHPYQPLTGAI